MRVTGAPHSGSRGPLCGLPLLLLIIQSSRVNGAFCVFGFRLYLGLSGQDEG